jgi:hypothetical protein
MELDLNSILNARNYEKICDFSIIPPEDKLFKEDIILKNSIIFCKTDFLDYLFNNLKNSKNKHIIVTHHSDYPIDEYRFSKKPECVIKWYAINPTKIHKDLIAIPLGVKTHSGIYYEERYMTKWFVKNADNLKSNKKYNKVYCNWTDTNPYRNIIIEKLKYNNIDITLESNMTFDQYAINMSYHKFVISPPGNGIDCHRTWESLYLGCIPIVIKNKIYDEFYDLPIIQVNDYSEVTNELLNLYNNFNFKNEKLYIPYWKKQIKESLL